MILPQGLCHTKPNLGAVATSGRERVVHIPDRHHWARQGFLGLHFRAPAGAVFARSPLSGATVGVLQQRIANTKVIDQAQIGEILKKRTQGRCSLISAILHTTSPLNFKYSALFPCVMDLPYFLKGVEKRVRVYLSKR